MKRASWLILLCVTALLIPVGLSVGQGQDKDKGKPGSGGTFKNRQYYSNWQKHPTQNYHFRQYYFKPNADYFGFKHHYVIHNPKNPGHLYFYNPETKQYWGRCPTKTGGKPAYSMLAEKDRKGTLAEIPEAAFPKPGPMPPIPDSTDNEPMDLPPDDLPAAEPESK